MSYEPCAKGGGYIYRETHPFFPLVLALIAPAHSAFAQTIQNASTQAALTSNAVQEMQKYDPQAAQELSRAIQKGDFLTAQKIYLDFKNKPPRAAAAEPAAEQPASQQPSLFERTLSGDFPSDALSTSLKQFGYETFLRTASTFAPRRRPCPWGRITSPVPATSSRSRCGARRKGSLPLR